MKRSSHPSPGLATFSFVSPNFCHPFAPVSLTSRLNRRPLAHFCKPVRSARRARFSAQSSNSRQAQSQSIPESQSSHTTEQPHEYFATCALGLGEFLAEEIRSPDVNAHVLSVVSSGVHFRATEPGHITAYKACLWLRTATRVLFKISSQHLDDLADPNSPLNPAENAYLAIKDATNWSHLLDRGRLTFSIQTRVSSDTSQRTHHRDSYRTSQRRRAPQSEQMLSDQALQIRVKDAICDALRDDGGYKPPRPISHAEADVPIFVTLHAGRLTLYLDMAGASLHKRGYRADRAVHRSQLNEAVAAGMLYMAGFLPDGRYAKSQTETEADMRQLVVTDPMCGSGTLLIELALLRLRVAVGLYRSNFAFERWPDFDEVSFRRVTDAAVAVQRDDSAARIRLVGSDVNARALTLASQDVDRLRLEALVELQNVDVRDVQAPKNVTLVLSNPPWGRRLDEGEAWFALGTYLREHAGGATAVFISGDASVTRGLRMKTRRKFPVRIGNVDTRVLVYDILPPLSEQEREERRLRRIQEQDEPVSTGERDEFGENELVTF